MVKCINKIDGVRCDNEALSGAIYCEQCKCVIAAGNKLGGAKYEIEKVVRGVLNRGRVFDIYRIK